MDDAKRERARNLRDLSGRLSVWTGRELLKNLDDRKAISRRFNVDAAENRSMQWRRSSIIYCAKLVCRRHGQIS